MFGNIFINMIYIGVTIGIFTIIIFYKDYKIQKLSIFWEIVAFHAFDTH